jgi:hypothetical protein
MSMIVSLQRTPLLRPILLMLGCILLAWGHYSGWLAGSVENATSALFAEARQYAEHAAAEAKATLMVLIGMHATLEVLTSGQVGISLLVNADITLGKLLAGLADLANKAYQTALMDNIVWYFYGLLLRAFQSSQGLLFNISLGCYLAAALTAHHLPRLTGLHRSLYRLARYSVLIFLSVGILFPLALVVAGKISQQLSQPARQEIHERYTQLDQHIRSQEDSSDMKGQAESALHLLEKLSVRLEEKVEAMASSLVRHLTVVVFDVLVMPTLLLIGFIWILRSGCGRRRLPSDPPAPAPAAVKTAAAPPGV